MNPKCLTTIYVPMQSLNFNLVPPTICPTHQKPLSYYNKYKPENDPICMDCLINETKDSKDSNLYVPFSNLEQEYYHQKNTFFQIIEKANNIKKYETYITNFQNLLSNYFTKFISKFLKEKISVDNSFQKKVDFCEKKKGPMSSKDIMNILNKVENEKFILDNKCADVFCQINKLQKILLKNNEKLAEAFKNLLEDFFEEPSVKISKEKEYILSKTQSNKKKSSEKDVEIQCRTNSSVPSNSSKKNQEFLSSTNINTNTLCQNEDISQFSINDDLNINDRIKQISNFGSININMQKERIFEENDEDEDADEKKNLSEKNEINNSFSDNKNTELSEDKNAKAEKELLKSINDKEELEWRPKKTDNNDDIYRDHKEKINQLIEQDKNKKSVNQSFFQTKRPKFKKKQNLNKSFQKNHSKYAFPKKREYNYYNQFNQNICKVCGESFFIIKSGFNEEERCDKCKQKNEENENFSHRRLRDYSTKNKKFGFFQKNFGSLLKKHHITSIFGNKKMFRKKMESSYNSHYLNRTLIHSNSTYIKQHFRMNSPKIKFGFNPKYRLNKGKENYDDNYIGKSKYVGHRKYNEKKNDDFEVDLDSGDEKTDNLNENDELNENEDNKSFEEEKFNKTINGFYRDDFREKNSENNSNENDEEKDKNSDNRNDFHRANDGDKSNDNFSDKNDLSDKEDNGDNMKNVNDLGEDNDFETDF